MAQGDGAQRRFLDWFTSRGGWYHPHLSFRKDAATGLSLFADEEIGADSTVVRMPRELGLSPQICRDKIFKALRVAQDELPVHVPRYESSNDWVVFYLFLVKLIHCAENRARPQALETLESTSSSLGKGLLGQELRDDAGAHDALGSHVAYVDMLPTDVITPLQYTKPELSLLKGTPLYVDALERREKKLFAYLSSLIWLREQCQRHPVALLDGTALQSVLLKIREDSLDSLLSSKRELLEQPEAAPAFSLWLWASTAYASRAFPPSMLARPDSDPRLLAPVLLPGIDAFNHARGVPVTWTSLCTATQNPADPAVAASETDIDPLKAQAAITIHYRVSRDEQIFNCYGAKSNEEFLAGYGFVLPQGPDDTVTLVVGGPKQTRDAGGTTDDGQEVSDGACNALSLRKPWGTRHYWQRAHEGKEYASAPAALLIELRERLIDVEPQTGESTTQDAIDTAVNPLQSDSWLLNPHVATPSEPSTPTDRTGTHGTATEPALPQAGGETPSSSLRRAAMTARRRLQDRLEALRLDGEVLETLESLLCAKRKAFKASQRTVDAERQQASESGGSSTEVVRESVWDAVRVYRAGQAAILDQAVAWTRDKMEELVDLIEGIEGKLES
ncbi:unnamed protein product [Parajaminaea phylloscopi]